MRDPMPEVPRDPLKGMTDPCMDKALSFRGSTPYCSPQYDCSCHSLGLAQGPYARQRTAPKATQGLHHGTIRPTMHA